MFKIIVEEFELTVSDTGYASEKGKRTVYEQTVDKLDVNSVIKAVNGND